MLKKPIKRNEHIMKHSREHHFSLLFCWKIRQGLKKDIDIERIRKYVQYFWQQHLQPHFRDEERILFAPIKDSQVQKAINEHKYIKQQIENLADYSANNVRKGLSKIAEIVDEHVRYEERKLFPHLERKLSKEQLEKIGKQIEKPHRSSLQDQFEDQFWNIK
ncbi:MAG: hemerythrin domain-containing protein [Chitinophagaceae bacterium]|nr:hemerythrin domain-containing protein [Chitinophagaceae bacterium]